jgi:hypothetical protein
MSMFEDELAVLQRVTDMSDGNRARESGGESAGKGDVGDQMAHNLTYFKEKTSERQRQRMWKERERS